MKKKMRMSEAQSILDIWDTKKDSLLLSKKEVEDYVRALLTIYLEDFDG